MFLLAYPSILHLGTNLLILFRTQFSAIFSPCHSKETEALPAQGSSGRSPVLHCLAIVVGLEMTKVRLRKDNREVFSGLRGKSSCFPAGGGGCTNECLVLQYL